MAGLVGHDGRFEGLGSGVIDFCTPNIGRSTYQLLGKYILLLNIRSTRGDVDTKLQLVVGKRCRKLEFGIKVR